MRCAKLILGTGVCASGLEKQYVSFYPEGRMDLYAALAEGTIPVTENALSQTAISMRQVRFPMLLC